MRFYTVLSRNIQYGHWDMDAFALKREAMDHAHKEVAREGEEEREVEVCRVDARGLTKMGLAIALCSRSSDMTGCVALGYRSNARVEQVTIFNNTSGVEVGSL